MFDLEKFSTALSNMTSEEISEIMGPSIPQGWVSVKEHLPQWLACDFMQGYSEYKCRDQAGNEFLTQVTDHHAWEVFVAIPNNITEWYNP